MELSDVAAQPDQRGVTIDRVGVRDLHLPVRIRQKSGGEARVVGVFDATVELPHYERGTHMSRFVEVLSRWSKKRVSQAEMREMLEDLRRSFDARAAYLSLRFKYFLDKRTPRSGLACQLDYDCGFDAKIIEGKFAFAIEVHVPVMTVCPCSLEICGGRAHSQRAMVSVRLGTEESKIVWLEDVIRVVEKQGSAEIYPLLKRQDEKFVVESAFANAKFVEDVVRDTVLAVREMEGVVWWQVECRAIESIHNHTAYAWAAGGAGAWRLR